MNIERFLTDNTLLIVPSNLKNKALEEIDNISDIKNIKIMSLEDVIKHLYFDYNDETIFKLMNKYDIKYSVSKTYIENMYFIDTVLYESDKLNDLVLKYRFLLDNNLLIIDSLFNKFLAKKKIVLYGYDYLTKFQKKVIETLKKITTVEIIYQEEALKHPITVYQFPTIEEEVEFVVKKIIELLNNKIDINRIKIAISEDDYYNLIEKMCYFNNLPISKKKIAIYDTKIGNHFLKLIEEGYDFLEAILKLQNLYQKAKEINIINQIIEICNNYTWYQEDKIKLIEIIRENLKETVVKEDELENKITITNFEFYNFDKDDYVFLVGFNHGVYPLIEKDEDFISDSLKQEIDIDTTIDKNKLAYDKLLNTIYKLKNLTITYKLRTPFDTFYPSIIIENEKFKVIDDYKVDLNISYSSIYNKIKLTKYLDQYLKYGVFDDRINLLYSNYKNLPYMTYDNRFTGIDREKIKSYLNNKLILSYSSIDNFYRCQFKYYLGNILKLDKYEETFKIAIGNIFHYILSICLEKGFDFEHEFELQIKNRKFTSEELFFLKKLKEELKLIIETVKEQHSLSGLTSTLLEEKVYINKNLEIPVTFMGVIDKLMYKEVNGITYTAIVDYKTGSIPIDLSNTYYGISMQLPIYIYLVNNMKKINNPFIVGFYLQKILHEEIKRDTKKSYLDQKRELLKLNGYSTDDVNILARFDPTYENSTMIKGMKTTSKGFSHYSKTISEEEISKLNSFIEDKIDKAANSIISADFKINPKRIDNKPIGCDFCPFMDICYKKETDYVDYEKRNGLDFLGGE